MILNYNFEGIWENRAGDMFQNVTNTGEEDIALLPLWPSGDLHLNLVLFQIV